MIKHEAALRLSSVLAVKGAGGGCGCGGEESWARYIDSRVLSPSHAHRRSHHTALPRVPRQRASSTHPTSNTLRDLTIRASATWQSGEVEGRARAAAEKEAISVAAEKEAERARGRRRGGIGWTRRRGGMGETAARKIRDEEESKARASAQADREEEKGRENSKREAARASESSPKEGEVGHTADLPTQKQIKAAMERLGLDKCPNGYAFVKTADGWCCTGGQHKITNAQLAASNRQTTSVV